MRRGTFCKKRVGPPDCRKNIFGFMWPLRPIDWFVGNGLDRSVLPCQKQDMAGKPRAIRRDFMRCARPDVRMGQDPSLQIFRKQTFSTRRLPPAPQPPYLCGILCRSYPQCISVIHVENVENSVESVENSPTYARPARCKGKKSVENPENPLWKFCAFRRETVALPTGKC